MDVTYSMTTKTYSPSSQGASHSFSSADYMISVLSADSGEFDAMEGSQGMQYRLPIGLALEINHRLHGMASEVSAP